MGKPFYDQYERDLYLKFEKAVANGNIEQTRDCILAGVDIHSSHMDDHTPLGVAAFEGHLEIVKLLIDAGSDVNAQQLYDRCTALMDAVSGGHLEIVKVLIEAGAKVDMLSTQGDTAETIAQYNKCKEILEYLESYR